MKYSRTIIGIALAAVCASAHAQTITTLFAGTTFAGDNNSGLYFNITTNSLDVEVTGWDWNLNEAATGIVTGISVWTRPGTAAGFEESDTGWVFQTGGSAVTAGPDNPSPVTQNSSFTLLANTTTGFMLVNGGNSTMLYTQGDGTGTYGSGTNQTYSNADMTITLGAATNSPWNNRSNGFFSPRVANFNMHYTAIPEPGSMIALGIGLTALLARRRRKLA